MTQTDRPFRSVLYIPGTKPRALEKARGLPVDAIIFDLEDAVAPDEKVAARETLAQALTDGGYEPRMCIVRVNGADTPWGADDLATFTELAVLVFSGTLAGLGLTTTAVGAWLTSLTVNPSSVSNRSIASNPPPMTCAVR